MGGFPQRIQDRRWDVEIASFVESFEVWLAVYSLGVIAFGNAVSVGFTGKPTGSHATTLGLFVFRNAVLVGFAGKPRRKLGTPLFLRPHRGTRISRGDQPRSWPTTCTASWWSTVRRWMRRWTTRGTWATTTLASRPWRSSEREKPKDHVGRACGSCFSCTLFGSNHRQTACWFLLCGSEVSNKRVTWDARGMFFSLCPSREKPQANSIFLCFSCLWGGGKGGRCPGDNPNGSLFEARTLSGQAGNQKARRQFGSV